MPDRELERPIELTEGEGEGEGTEPDIDDNEGEASDDEITEDSDEAARAARDEFYQELRDAVEELSELIESAFSEIRVESGREVEMDILDSTHISNEQNGDETISGIRDRLDEMETRLQEIKEDAGGQKRKGRLFCRVKGINFLLGLTIGTAFILDWVYGHMKAASETNKRPLRGPDSGLDDDKKLQLEDHIKKSWALSSDEFWNGMARFCDRWNPSWQGQILMLDTIKAMSQPLDPPWHWIADEKADRVDTIRDAYADFHPGEHQRKSRAIYVSVKGIRYDGFGTGPEGLPRQVAAELCELAIGEIYALIEKAVRL